MSWWLLNHFSTWALALLVFGSLISLAVVGCLVIRRRVPSVAQGGNTEVAGVILSVFGGIYGIVLAFVIVVLWEQFQSAQAVVSAEANALAQIVRDSQAFPPEEKLRVNDAVHRYAHAVVEDEWSLMNDRRESAPAWAAIDDLYRAVQDFVPADANQGLFYQEISATLDELLASRRQRLRQSQYGLPGVLELLIVVGALMIIGFIYFLGTSSQRAHLSMSGAVAALLAFNLLLALLLEHPFTGDLAVKNTAFQQSDLAQFWSGRPLVLPRVDEPSVHP